MKYHKSENEITYEYELIRNTQKDPAQFEPLYNKYYEQIFLFVYKRTCVEALCADLTSMVFLKALANIKKYKFKGVPFSAWLYRIAINEINQYYRKTKKHRSISIEESGLENLLSNVEEEKDEEKQRLLFLAMERLPKESINMIQLRFFENHSFKEIGQIYNITENNAKVKIYRILDKIRKMLRQNND